MIEAQKGKVHIWVEKNRYAPDCCVAISFDTKVNGCCLSKLKSSGACDCFPSGSEETCLCYAMFLAVQETLCGSPLAVKKSKVSSVQCGVADGSFVISWCTKGNLSSVRKTVGMAFKKLTPSKYFTPYSHCVRLSGGQPTRETFNHCAAKLNSAMSSAMHIGVCGAINTDKKKLEEALDVMESKFDPSAVEGKKAEPKGHKPCDHSSMTEIRCKGWPLFVTKDYIESKMPGRNIQACGSYLLLNIKPAQWSTATKKLKDMAGDYVKQKYTKLGDDLGPVLGYMMLRDAVCAVQDVKPAARGVSGSQLEKAIKDSL
jgi:hypothetical protein